MSIVAINRKKHKPKLCCEILCVRNCVCSLFPGRNGPQDCTIWDPTPPGGMSPYSSLHSQPMPGQLLCSFNSQPLCCIPRLCASGLGHSSLHLGSAFSASHSGACVQTEAERPVEQTYVLPICTNKRTHTHFHVHAMGQI